MGSFKVSKKQVWIKVINLMNFSVDTVYKQAHSLWHTDRSEANLRSRCVSRAAENVYKVASIHTKVHKVKARRLRRWNHLPIGSAREH